MSLLFLSTLIATALSHYHYVSDPPPPAQDQCKNVNASEPLECPNHIGPPCPPCYTNYRSDYEPTDSLAFSTSTKKTMTDFMNWYINWWPSNYPPTKSASGYNIFVGAAGRGQMHLRLYQHSNNNQTLLNIATEYINKSLSELPRNQQYSSYMFGHIGVWTLTSIIQDINGNNNEMQLYLNKVIDTFKNVQTAIIKGESKSSDGLDLTKCGLDEGLSGMLFNALFLNEYYKKDVISIDIISNITFYILDFGIKTGKQLNTNYLQYLCPFIKDCYLWGPGHGATGVMHTVYTAYMKYPQQLSELFDNIKYYDALKNTLDFYISIELADGNMPTNTQGTCESDYGDDPDARVQWCHGAPGFTNVFSLSSVLFAETNTTAAEEYFHVAIRLGNVTWDRGLLVKGTMYCHGIGGNINMLWELSQTINYLQNNGNKQFIQQLENDGYDLTFLKNQMAWRAKQFVIWTLNWSNIDKTRIYDSNEGYSMYQGNFALPMTYIQMLSNGWPFDEPVCHPGWHLCL